jgi:hypothetical protein
MRQKIMSSVSEMSCFLHVKNQIAVTPNDQVCFIEWSLMVCLKANISDRGLPIISFLVPPFYHKHVLVMNISELSST